jgi:hypothetical protein
VLLLASVGCGKQRDHLRLPRARWLCVICLDQVLKRGSFARANGGVGHSYYEISWPANAVTYQQMIEQSNGH